jgi:hypothetical protein
MGGAEEVPAAVAVGVAVDFAAPNTPGAFTDMGGAEEVPAAEAVGVAVEFAAPNTLGAFTDMGGVEEFIEFGCGIGVGVKGAMSLLWPHAFMTTCLLS